MMCPKRRDFIVDCDYDHIAVPSDYYLINIFLTMSMAFTAAKYRSCFLFVSRRGKIRIP